MNRLLVKIKIIAFSQFFGWRILAILTSLVTTYKPSELELYLADPKRVELNLFRNTKHCKKFVYEIQDITELIADLLAETNKRYDLFMKYEVTNIFEYNKLKGEK